jgi:hypothetical protein
LDREIGGDLLRSRDLRWAGTDAVWIVVPTKGIFKLDLNSQKPPVLDIPAGSVGGRHEAFIPSRLGASSTFLGFGSTGRVMGWKRPGEPELQGQAPVLDLVDLDVWQDRFLILGTRKSPEGELAPEGAIAWIGSLGQDLADMQSTFFDSSGAHADNFTNCEYLELGAVRFLADGSYIIAPGTEPGVYHFSGDGKLLQTWQDEAIGLEGGCDLSYMDKVRLAANLEERFAVRNLYRSVDDILPMPQGPALIVRTANPRGTSWQLKLLKDNGKVETHQLPIESPTGMAHLRGDVRGDLAVFLVVERSLPKVDPAVNPRIVVARIKL